MDPADVVAAHRAAGRSFSAAGVRSFVREAGDGDPVVCLHGVPVSSFVYRRVLDELAARGLRGIAFDLPGLGLAERPEAFDYTWTGLGRFAVAAVDALDLDSFHLVVHDVGGPVGFELATAMPGRVRSLTILDTIVEVEKFTRPIVMEPFALRPPIGELYLRSMNRATWLALVYALGIKDRTAVSAAELMAHLDLLKREDDGRAFLRIMRGFERTREKSRLYVRAARGPYPRQVVWGEDDAALPLAHFGELARRAAEVEHVHRLPAKHFLQEDQAAGVAERVAVLAAQA